MAQQGGQPPPQREHHWHRAGEGAGDRIFPDLPAGSATRGMAEHVERYLGLARKRRAGQAVPLPEDLYLVDADGQTIREIIGFRLRGHPMAMLGALRFPRHANAPTAYGRPSLSYFFSKPPAQMKPGEVTPPPGMIELFLPHVGESMVDMMDRLRNRPRGRGVQVDVSLVDFAFDLRLANPSAIPGQGAQLEQPQRRLFRTTRGHVLSGISVGFYKTLRKGLQFVTLTDAIQHRPGTQHLLPTMAFNRRVLAVETVAGPGSDSDAQDTLAFHPSTANPIHILGWPYDRVQEQPVTQEFDGVFVTAPPVA